MTTTAHRTRTRPSGPRGADLSELTDLDASGVPCFGEQLGRVGLTRIAVPGLSSGSVVTSVQRVEPPRPQRLLAWGTTECRTVLFEVDEQTAGELKAQLDAGEEPTVIVEPAQLVAVDIEALP